MSETQTSLFGDDEEEQQRKRRQQPTSLPYVKGSETSRAAAQVALRTATTKRARVFQAIAQDPERGCTDDEGMVITGIEGSTYHPRRIELEEAGLIYDSGERRLTRKKCKAVVWKVVKA